MRESYGPVEIDLDVIRDFIQTAPRPIVLLYGGTRGNAIHTPTVDVVWTGQRHPSWGPPL
ncbi:MAG TPA: hypothetical protein PKL08_00830 [Thermoanaerobaculaceae bacterium]|nr:hypothetical protein [Thermoanaerobaculaceae bacterium]